MEKNQPFLSVIGYNPTEILKCTTPYMSRIGKNLHMLMKYTLNFQEQFPFEYQRTDKTISTNNRVMYGGANDNSDYRMAYLRGFHEMIRREKRGDNQKLT